MNPNKNNWRGARRCGSRRGRVGWGLVGSRARGFWFSSGCFFLMDWNKRNKPAHHKFKPRPIKYFVKNILIGRGSVAGNNWFSSRPIIPATVFWLICEAQMSPPCGLIDYETQLIKCVAQRSPPAAGRRNKPNSKTLFLRRLVARAA